ncbi:anion permease [Marinobacterium sp. CAU 1594]|nr:anion permease [Marinobacterium arenosum]
MAEQAPSHSPSLSAEPAAQVSRHWQFLTARGWQFIGILAATLAVGVATAQYLPINMAFTAALSVFCIGLWATVAVPEYWTALAFFLAVIVLDIAPAETALSGFHSSTFWLLFSGLVLGAAVRHTGLGQRAALLLSGIIGTGYAGVIVGIVAFSLALAFVIPSAMGRIALLVPLILALADGLGYQSNSNGRIGMLSAGAFGTCLPAFSILPANAPNMILAGMAENLFGQHLSYWDYLLLHFPVLGVAKAALLILLILWMFPAGAPAHSVSQQQKPAPLSPTERRLSLVLGLCLAFWLSDGIHHIAPGWIALAAALYCLWPHSQLTSKTCLNREINYGSLFFVAGIIGLGAVVSATGLGEALVQGLSAQADFSEDSPGWNVVLLTAISTLVAIVTNLPGVPAVMTPIAEEMATLTALPLTTVLMTQVLAFSNVFLPYQAPPLVTAMQIGHLPAGAVSRLCLALFAISTLILMPLDLVWWHLLGVF